MNLSIRQVNISSIREFISILIEAAEWMDSIGMKNWDSSKFSIDEILIKSELNDLFLCYADNEPAGCLKLQETDMLFWPDDIKGEALYVHKLAVKRIFAGKGISTFMMDWAKEQAKLKKCNYLKLDCLANRSKLCMVYEKQGFIKVDEKLVFGEVKSALYQLKV